MLCGRPEGWLCVKGICSEALFREVSEWPRPRHAKRPSSLSAWARGDLAAASRPLACLLCPAAVEAWRGGEGRCARPLPVAAQSTRRLPSDSTARRPGARHVSTGTPGAERRVPTPARPFRCWRESAELRVSRGRRGGPGRAPGAGQRPAPAHLASLPWPP